MVVLLFIAASICHNNYALSCDMYSWRWVEEDVTMYVPGGGGQIKVGMPAT